jgi:hypothetical protein
MRILTIIFLVFFSNLIFGQKIYRADRDNYKTNKFIYEFHILKDSACYLRGHYLDNSVYYLYKGTLNKINNTLYEFKYRPIVVFTCNKGIHINDSLRFYLAQVDTIISSLTYNLKTESGIFTTVNLKLGRTIVYVKGSYKHYFYVDTKIVDPLTREKILFTVDENSDPDFTYYGTNTDLNTAIVSIAGNKLTVYPDHKYIHDKDTFVLIK